MYLTPVWCLSTSVLLPVFRFRLFQDAFIMRSVYSLLPLRVYTYFCSIQAVFETRVACLYICITSASLIVEYSGSFYHQTLEFELW